MTIRIANPLLNYSKLFFPPFSPPPPPPPPPKRVIREGIYIMEEGNTRNAPKKETTTKSSSPSPHPGMKIGEDDRSTLKLTEPHPAASMAMDYLRQIPLPDLFFLQEAFATNAIEGNRLSEVCLGTLNRLLHSEPVSDRYLLGLAWAVMRMREEE